MKKKTKTWDKLNETKCPKCGEQMMQDMFSGKILGCVCGFTITKETKELLVKRDNENI